MTVDRWNQIFNSVKICLLVQAMQIMHKDDRLVTAVSHVTHFLPIFKCSINASSINETNTRH